MASANDAADKEGYDARTQHRHAGHAPAGSDKSPPSLPVTGTAGRIHELRIHQVELERQNISLRQSQAALEKSRDAYLSLWESSPIGYVILDIAGRVSAINRTGLTLFGRPLNALLDARFSTLLSAEDQAPVHRLCESALATGLTRKQQVRITRPDETRSFCLMEISPVRGEAGEDQLQAALVDITAQKEAEYALQKSEDEKVAILDSLVDNVVYQTREMKILWANKAACRSVQMRREDLINRHCFAIWANRSSPCEDCPVIKAYATRKVESIEKQTPDGRFWKVIGIPSKDEKGDIHAMTEVAIDISERKQAEQRGRQFREELEHKVMARTAELTAMNRQLAQEIELKKNAEDHIRNLSQQLLKSQEDERQMIARELHDGVAQDLSSLQIGLSTLLPRAGDADPGMLKKMTAFSSTLQRTINVVRDLTYDLRLPGLEGIGLVPALSMYCEDFAEKSGLEVLFLPLGMHNIKMDFDTGMNLYRLIQEGLRNIRKHAAAKRATVKLISAHPNIILHIQDDGAGFDVEERERNIDREKRMGLRSMAERVSLISGEMKIRSSPRKGTHILIKFPFRKGKNASQKDHIDR